MANTKSAAKRAKTSAVSRDLNRAVRSRIANTRKAYFEAVESGAAKDKIQTLFQTYCSELDKAAKNGVIKRNNADRRKSRANLKLNTAAKA